MDNIIIPVLDWWQEESQRRTYPSLFYIAIDIFSAVAISAESERVFNASRRTIAWTRARLEVLLIKQLECLKHWHKAGLVPEAFVLDNDDDEVIPSTKGTDEATPSFTIRSDT